MSHQKFQRLVIAFAVVLCAIWIAAAFWLASLAPKPSAAPEPEPPLRKLNAKGVNVRGAR